MYIRKLHIQNFRGLSEIILDFPQTKLTVLIGVNGAGKSSVLDCIAIMLAEFIAVLRNSKNPEMRMTEKDININSASTANTINVLTELGEKLCWKIVQERTHQEGVYRRKLIDDPETMGYIRQIQENLKHDSNFSLPVMVYYQTHRMVLKNPYTFNSKGSKKRKEELFYQFYTYEKSFSTGINDFQDFFDWFKEEEDYENEIRLRDSHDYRNPKLEVIRKAITSFLERFSSSHFLNLRVVRSTKDRGLYSDQMSSKPSLNITKNHEDLSLEQLSDGEKILLMLVTDLAMRLAIANPSSDEALRGKGIVLIDEIELHLHPQWQRTVVQSLTQTFPNCQFILTTHSPQVLSGVKRENVFILKDYHLVEKIPYTYGKDTNSILYELMNVKERPDEVQKQINQCFKLIDDGNLKGAKSALNKLSNLLGKDDSEVVRANMLISFLEE